MIAMYRAQAWTSMSFFSRDRQPLRGQGSLTGHQRRGARLERLCAEEQRLRSVVFFLSFEHEFETHLAPAVAARGSIRNKRREGLIPCWGTLWDGWPRGRTRSPQLAVGDSGGANQQVKAEWQRRRDRVHPQRPQAHYTPTFNLSNKDRRPLQTGRPWGQEARGTTRRKERWSSIIEKNEFCVAVPAHGIDEISEEHAAVLEQTSALP